MFDALRQSLREAVDNFRSELNRDAVPEAADKLIRAMERELVESKLILDRLAEDVAKSKEEADAEERELAACLRREEMALRINDEETARVAREFAARHLRRKDLLDDKIRVLERELADRRVEVDDMLKQVKGARAKREAMISGAGRAGARDQLHEAGRLFDDLDRMAERIGDLDANAQAAQEMDETFADSDPSGWNSSRRSPPTDAELSARLEALKERMRDG